MPKKPKIVKPRLATVLELMELLFKAGDDQSMYTMMTAGTACAFNMTLAAGATIEEYFEACPHTSLFSTALDRCGSSYQVTQLSPEKLLIRSGEFQAYIPCLLPSALSWPIPDAPGYPATSDVIDAIWKVAGLAETKAETVLEGSIQLNSGSCIATDRRVIMEAWHGVDMPTLLIPRVAANVLHKIKGKLISFGFSKETLTFHFDDNTWVRTQLYQDKPIHIARQFHGEFNPRPVPSLLFEAAKKVAPFSTSGSIFIKDGFIRSHPPGTQEKGSELSLPLDDIHAPRNYDYDDLKLIQKHVTHWDETTRDNCTYFQGDSLRGLIVHGIIKDR